jgi:hypothetical protein
MKAAVAADVDQDELIQCAWKLLRAIHRDESVASLEQTVSDFQPKLGVWGIPAQTAKIVRRSLDLVAQRDER